MKQVNNPRNVADHHLILSAPPQ